MNFAMATLGLKEMGKFLWEGREKNLPSWLSQFSKTKLNQQGRPFSLTSQRNFPISFKPKVAITEFFWKMQRKTWYSILGVDAMPLSLKNLLLKTFYHMMYGIHCNADWTRTTVVFQSDIIKLSKDKKQSLSRFHVREFVKL